MIQVSVPVTRNHCGSGHNLPVQGCEENTWDGRKSSAAVSLGYVLAKSHKVTSECQAIRKLRASGFRNVKAVGNMVSLPAVCVGDLVL